MDWNFASNGCYNQANALVAAANILSIPALAAIATTYPLPSFAHLASQQQQQQINNEHSNNNNNTSSINNNQNSSNNFAHVLQQLPFNTTRILNNNENANKSVKNVSNELLNNNKIENSSTSTASYNNNNNNNNYDDKYSECDSNYGMNKIFQYLINFLNLIF